MRACVAVALCLFALAAGTTAARADGASDARLRDALRSTTAQLRVLEEEQAKWQAKDAEYQRQLQALRTELLEAKQGAAKRGPDRAARQHLAEQSALTAKAEEALQQCRKEADSAAAAESLRAKDREDEHAAAAHSLEELARRAGSCEAKNERLTAAARQFLGFISGSGSMLCEPLLGLRRVELENKQQEFEDKLLDNKAGR